MTPAERLAALKALKFGLDQAIDEATIEVRDLMDETGADRYRTQFGAVFLGKRADSIIFDDQELMRFAEATDLDGVETIKQVRSTFRALFVADGETVIFNPTGEVIDFARVRTGTKYLSAKLTDEGKERALQTLSATLTVVSEQIKSVSK